MPPLKIKHGGSELKAPRRDIARGERKLRDERETREAVPVRVVFVRFGEKNKPTGNIIIINILFACIKISRYFRLDLFIFLFFISAFFLLSSSISRISMNFGSSQKKKE